MLNIYSVMVNRVCGPVWRKVLKFVCVQGLRLIMTAMTLTELHFLALPHKSQGPVCSLRFITNSVCICDLPKANHMTN